MTVFFDNCTSPVLASTLHGYIIHLGHEAVHIKDLSCRRNATDVEWISYLRDSGDDWMVVPGDRQIHRNKAERQAFRQAKLKGFVFAAAYQKLSVNQQAALLLWRWPDIEALLALAPPFLFELPVNRTSRIRVLPF